MGSFDMSLQVEDFVNSDSEDLMALMQENEEVYCGIDSLAQYGETVGFGTTQYYAACEEAFVNASKEIISALSFYGIYTAEGFSSFVTGFAFAKRYLKMF